MQKNRNSLHDSPLRAIHYPTPGDNSLPKHLIQSDMSRVWPQLRFLKILTHFFAKQSQSIFSCTLRVIRTLY